MTTATKAQIEIKIGVQVTGRLNWDDVRMIGTNELGVTLCATPISYRDTVATYEVYLQVDGRRPRKADVDRIRTFLEGAIAGRKYAESR